MANEVITLPARTDTGSNLPVTSEDVEALKRQRSMLREFVHSQLRQDVDYGTIPGTPKPTLFKPGAEKLARLFGLGVRLSLADKEIDRKDNFAIFTYKAEVYLLRQPTVVISDCEASCNSQEKKYRERKAWKEKDGKRVQEMEDTPVCDVLNTLQKMAQKRAMVGAIILAVGGSDFFTQDIDDPEDAAQVGVNQRAAPARAQVSVPKATATASQHQAAPVQASQSADQEGPMTCEACGTEMRLSRNGDAYTCPNWKDQTKGKHSYVPV